MIIFQRGINLRSTIYCFRHYSQHRVKMIAEKDRVVITEGSATMNYDKKEAVFYNKVQVFNRDLSIEVIKYFSEVRQAEKMEKYNDRLKRYNESKDRDTRPEPRLPEEGIKILDALAATGLRSIRYLKEIPHVKHVTINDLDETAVKTALENCKSNHVDENLIKVNHGDAALFMYHHREHDQQFDVIDLDPYGSASPFLDAAVQAVSDGGLLCVTCTDAAVLAGVYPDVSFSRYNCLTLKSPYKHEMSLRVLLHSIDVAANRYKRYIVPWISISIDFYVRVFVRVYVSAEEVKRSSLKRMMVYESTQCPSFYIQPLTKLRNNNTIVPATLSVPSKCPETGGNMRIGGPFWGAAIHNQYVVDTLLNRLNSYETGMMIPISIPSTITRLKGILTIISEELKDVPLYYDLTNISCILKIQTPPAVEIRSALVNAGYRVSQFHHEPLALKTDASPQVVWDIMRAYCKKLLLENPTLSTTTATTTTTTTMNTATTNSDINHTDNNSNDNTNNTNTNDNNSGSNMDKTDLEGISSKRKKRLLHELKREGEGGMVDHHIIKKNIMSLSNKKQKQNNNNNKHQIDNNNNNTTTTTTTDNNNNNDDDGDDVEEGEEENNGINIDKTIKLLNRPTVGEKILSNPILTSTTTISFAYNHRWNQGDRPSSLSSSSSSTTTTTTNNNNNNNNDNKARSTTTSAIKRFAPNPEKFWGPKKRAGTKKESANNDDNEDKQQKDMSNATSHTEQTQSSSSSSSSSSSK